MSSDYLDKQGNCKTVSQRAIDIIHVKAQGISSLADKEYLLNDLYQQIELADKALEMLENPEEARKVKQKKAELLRLRDNMESVRQYILNFRIQPEHYGLYIKYPPGFEG